MRKLLLVLLLSIIAFRAPACKEAAETAVPKLIEQLKSSDRGERNKAALALARYGKDAEPAVQPLIRTLDDENRGVQTSAALALRNIGTPEAINALDSHRN